MNECPICYEQWYGSGSHTCSPAKLKEIERGRKAAATRAENNTQPSPYYGTRLAAGMRLADPENNLT